MSQTADEVPAVIVPAKQDSTILTFLKRLVKEKPLGLVGGVILLIMLLTGIFADILAPYPYKEVHPVDRVKPPSSEYLLGTDSLGRDVFSRIIYGARVSMIVGIGATAFSTFLGTLIGLTSGYIGGRFDLIVQRFIDAWICLPSLVVFLLLLSLFGRGMLQMIIVLGIGGIGGSRGARALAFWIKESAYVSAAKAIGGSIWRIVWRHLLPNVMPVIIIGFSMGMGGVILAEASLSFLGYGIPPPFPSWGQMISGEARSQLERAPWLVLWPGLSITLAVWGVNMFGDAVRDLLDPRLRGGVGGMGEFGAQRARKALEKKKPKLQKLNKKNA